ncbi:hypothetical protein CO033_01045 [Candidatus Nomurabacteria bacterium CG_4_9_14_0_2_um_filter_32_10]|uniref:Response regulatory domain-containing protein n=3 Tax=Candidatus Nomuraibacteriota TaxID=1752729 RepID=A0A2H0CH16_9BACT|nr:MAG: hypothetical protein COW91_00615 [Candidatus Nomurabacteria bacterium CG22_combo_CG10-13_8_21_14_all_32_8]PIZ86427.1 MAG: hypothetical protein COX94_00150 [Candidatus Nomurabacteria bacterium CG_4_10_14_0_2_um_filter_33_9]PJC49524.1 MAG: hypothetical protein CO033_01045 [Candidatus Nomurabacteria bacterium CG_4_9_14_0_2_um_filter_32_10]
MKKVRVLLVDKDEYSILFMTRLFKKMCIVDLVFTSTSNGFEALDKIKNEQFSLILTELMVHPIGGFELIKKIRSLDSYKNVPILVVTATVTRRSKEESLAVGATDFIAKPFNDLKYFIEKMKSYL